MTLRRTNSGLRCQRRRNCAPERRTTDGPWKRRRGSFCAMPWGESRVPATWRRSSVHTLARLGAWTWSCRRANPSASRRPSIVVLLQPREAGPEVGAASSPDDDLVGQVAGGAFDRVAHRGVDLEEDDALRFDLGCDLAHLRLEPRQRVGVERARGVDDDRDRVYPFGADRGQVESGVDETPVGQAHDNPHPPHEDIGPATPGDSLNLMIRGRPASRRSMPGWWSSGF